MSQHSRERERSGSRSATKSEILPAQTACDVSGNVVIIIWFVMSLRCQAGGKAGETGHNQLPAVPHNGPGYHNIGTHLNNHSPPLTAQFRSISFIVEYLAYFCI